MQMNSTENPLLRCEEEKADLDFDAIVHEIAEVAAKDKAKPGCTQQMWFATRSCVIDPQYIIAHLDH